MRMGRQMSSAKVGVADRPVALRPTEFCPELGFGGPVPRDTRRNFLEPVLLGS